MAATAATALPWAAALCTCAAHARHPSTSCLFQQQAVDVFVWRKKETAWLCHRTRPRSFSPPPASPSVRHSCICYQEMKGESTSLHCNYLGKLALRVHNHHSAAQCKMLFFFFSSILLRLSTARIVTCTFRALPFKCFSTPSAIFHWPRWRSFSPESGHSHRAECRRSA